MCLRNRPGPPDKEARNGLGVRSLAPGSNASCVQMLSVLSVRKYDGCPDGQCIAIVLYT